MGWSNGVQTALKRSPTADFGIRAVEPSGCATAVLIHENGSISIHLPLSNGICYCLSFLFYFMFKAGVNCNTTEVDRLQLTPLKTQLYIPST
jgi:hypothetical protein